MEMSCTFGRHYPCVMNIRTFLLHLLVNLAVCFSYGQDQPSSIKSAFQLKADNWQMDQGLPVNSIMTAAQTTDGWMFFGTEEGLVRFDGNAFLLMDKSTIPGLKVNFIGTLLGGRDTSLWIGTEGDGLLRYKHNTFFKYNKSNGLSDDRIFTLYEDPLGGLWVGTSGGGLNYLKNGKISRLDTTHGLASNYIRAIAIDEQGRIWVGTQKGLSRICNGKIKNYFRKDGLSDDFIEALAFDKNQNLWIGTKSGGLNMFKDDKFSVYTEKDGLSNNAVTTLCFDRNGMLWIGTNGGGITRMLKGKFFSFTTKDGLSGDLIANLFEDHEGNIWVGTSGTGIDRIRKKTIQTLTARDGLPGNVILPIFEDHEGVLWFGIAGKGLIRLTDGRLKTFTQKDGLPDHLVLAITEDLDHTIWIGTAGGGLTGFREGKFKTYTTEDGLSNNVIVSLFCDKSGTLWAGTTGGGLNRLKNGRFSAITATDGLSHDNVTIILEDRKENLWVGTNRGLNKINDNMITVINNKNGLSNDYILSLFEDSDGNLWVGTADGLNMIKDNKIIQFGIKDGLVDGVVLKILEDEYGYLWISCNKGIYKIRKQELLDYAVSKLKSLNPLSFGKADGMETMECNGGVTPAGCKTRDGKLFFPTMKGISIIDPYVINMVSSSFPPLFIEEFLVDGQAVNMNSPVSVPSFSKRLEFRYAALNYTNPGRIRYRCMLEGFDKHWIECSTLRSAYYTNIPGGDYTFKVMASNESGQWDERLASGFKFHMEPPFYRSFLFYVGIVILILLLTFFVTYYFMGRIQRKRLKLLVEERTKELHQKIIAQEQTQAELQKINAALLTAKEQAESGDRLKTAFMNNISHEIRTPLNGIIGFSHLMTDLELSQDEKEHYCSVIKSNSDRLLNTVTDYMDISLLVSGNQEILKKQFIVSDLLDEIHDRFMNLPKAKKLALIMQKPKSSGELQINTDRGLLSKVLCHLLDNAIKFTNQGSVTFGCEIRGADLEFYVKDTGVGINPEVQEKIFEKFVQENVADTRGHEGSGLGLSIVRGILELLGGHIRLESVKGEGSSFFFTLPFGMLADEKTADPGNSIQKTVKPLILIADDEPSSSLFVQRILNKEGIESIIVTDGKQAVEACHQNLMISMVLMDMKMPVMDGVEATKRIKSFCPHLPVIAVTAYALSGDEKRALDAGCDDYVAKPFEKELLLKKMRKFGQLLQSGSPDHPGADVN